MYRRRRTNNTTRSQPDSYFRPWVHTQSTLVAYIRRGMKRWKKLNCLCWKAIARRHSCETGLMSWTWDVVCVPLPHRTTVLFDFFFRRLGEPLSVSRSSRSTTLGGATLLLIWDSQKYPNSKITGLSNSSTQRQHILSVAEQRNLKNLEVWSICFLLCVCRDIHIRRSLQQT